MQYYNYIVTLLIVTFFSCNFQKEKPTELSISSVSIIHGQINHIDTSFYQITKFETNNNKTDTTFITREIFHIEANGFLELDDITNNKFAKNYTEEKIIDETQQTLSIIHSAKNENLEIQKQIMIVDISNPSNAKVTSIFIDKIIATNSTSVQQRLFWQLDSYFQIATITTTKEFLETTKLVRITWR